MCNSQFHTRQQDRECNGICFIMLALVSLLVIIIMSITMGPLIGSETERCVVTNVSYPTELPTNTDYLNEHFVSCDCGKRCISDAGYCVKVYVEYANQTFMAMNQLSTFGGDQCTFAETECYDGESISDRLAALQEAAELVAPYETMARNSTIIDCYIYGGNIFLENQNDMVFIITMSIVGGFMIIFIIAAIHYCRQIE